MIGQGCRGPSTRPHTLNMHTVQGPKSECEADETME